MQNASVTAGHQPTIEAEMLTLRQHVADYRAVLNQEGVWLFLATLGCWGVSNHILQFFAFLVAVMLFGERAKNRVKETRSFPKLVKALEARIAELLPEGDARKARLYDLSQFQETEMSALNSFKNTKIFFLCWSFYGASFVYLIVYLAPRNVG
jgi:hypothetical protein